MHRKQNGSKTEAKAKQNQINGFISFALVSSLADSQYLKISYVPIGIRKYGSWVMIAIKM